MLKTDATSVLMPPAKWPEHAVVVGSEQLIEVRAGDECWHVQPERIRFALSTDRR
jgi:hypothetical protein